MNNYPEVVAKIAGDYLARVRAQLRMVPDAERDEFLREIQSHIYEAYQETAGDDDVARILAVLRNLGEPAEVVADRLPGAIVRTGMKRNLPLYIVAGILIALFGIPLGLGGAGVMVGILAALAGIVIAYYSAAGAVLLSGAVFMLFGLVRMYQPELWDKMVISGYIRLDGPLDDLLGQLSPPGQGFLLILVACVFIAAGLGMLWLGRYMLRGLRFLSGLMFDWIRRWAQTLRRRTLRASPPARQRFAIKLSFSASPGAAAPCAAADPAGSPRDRPPTKSLPRPASDPPAPRGRKRPCSSDV
jgi:uncharacterized membrane protein